MAGEMIEFQSNGGACAGYLATPDAPNAEVAGAGLIVLQEWWGLVPHIKNVCDRFSREGFVALAPDLYHGKTTRSPDEAGKLMMALNVAETEKDLRGAVEYLLAHERVASERVGTVGFCMGGVLSLYAACENRSVGACVVFYGIHPKVKPQLENLNAPMLGLYAERDSFAPPEAARALEAQLKELGKEAEIHIYENSDHAFFNDERPEVYNPEAAADAWRRTIRFFHQQLVEQTS